MPNFEPAPRVFANPPDRHTGEPSHSRPIGGHRHDPLWRPRPHPFRIDSGVNLGSRLMEYALDDVRVRPIQPRLCCNCRKISRMCGISSSPYVADPAQDKLEPPNFRQ